jgi:hypothetical protein
MMTMPRGFDTRHVVSAMVPFTLQLVADVFFLLALYHLQTCVDKASDNSPEKSHISKKKGGTLREIAWRNRSGSA